jgi:hypothetical protein
MTEPLSPAAQAVYDAAHVADSMPAASLADAMAAALRAAADHIDHDWSAFNCVDALYEIAAELDNSAQQ